MMISASDILHIISETHQFSILLLELRDTITFGISHSSDGRLNYFRIDKPLTASERNSLTGVLSSGRVPETLYMLGVEEFIQQVEGQRAKHIWLETMGENHGERVFASLSELKNFLRTI